MTINGGKPHAVGDRGQRYEVTFFSPATFRRQVLGWADSLDGAERMAAGIRAHPAWEQPEIVDRHEPPNALNTGTKQGVKWLRELEDNTPLYTRDGV